VGAESEDRMDGGSVGVEVGWVLRVVNGWAVSCIALIGGPMGLHEGGALGRFEGWTMLGNSSFRYA